MPTNAQKAARDKWDRENMTVITCKVTKEKAIRFKKNCELLGTTKSTVISKAIDDFNKKAEGQ